MTRHGFPSRVRRAQGPGPSFSKDTGGSGALTASLFVRGCLQQISTPTVVVSVMTRRGSPPGASWQSRPVALAAGRGAAPFCGDIQDVKKPRSSERDGA